MTNFAFRRHSRNPRAALLGAVAAVALGAFLFGLAPARPALAEAPLAQLAPASGPASFADVVERVKGAVVAIKVKAVETPNNEGEEGPELSPDDPLYDFFKRFGQGRGGMPQKHVTQSQGSGFVISADGYVVTNNHVVDHASEVEVVLDSGKTLPAKIIGTDKRTDLALLKINDGGNLPFVEWSNAMPRVGDWVIAVGNPFGLGGTVTAGIVSARGRDIGAGPYDDFLQIDAPVNRGNSGGPAFDTHGGVIGVNTAIYSPSGGSVGIAFDIPASTAERVVGELKANGHVTRGWLGVQIQGLTPELADSLGLKTITGALVAAPQDGSPAEQAGIKPGDLITEVNGQEVKDARDLAKKVADIAPGSEARLTLNRDGQTKTLTVKVGELPDKPVQHASVKPDTKTGMGDLGIRVASASEISADDSKGLAVVGVEPGGKAAEAGLAEGDIILKVGDEAVNRADDLRRALSDASKSGRKNALALVKRNGDQRFIALPTSVG